MNIVFDLKLGRPGCVLVQAAMGGMVHGFQNRFPVKTWLVAPTPDMQLYDVTETQLAQLVAISKRAIAPKKFVVHCKSGEPFDVYVGRPSPFGNKFRVGRDGTRDEVIAKFETWVRTQPKLMKRIRCELKNKVLACWCVPKKRCHAEVLVRIANE